LAGAGRLADRHQPVAQHIRHQCDIAQAQRVLEHENPPEVFSTFSYHETPQVHRVAQNKPRSGHHEAARPPPFRVANDRAAERGIMGTRNRAAVVVWSPAVIVAAAGVVWPLLSHEPDAMPVARQADRDAPLARKGDYLIPRVKPPPYLSARWVPLAPAVKMGGELSHHGSPSIEGPSPPPDPPSSPASEGARAEATPQQQARVRHDRDVCAAHGMRREDFYRDNHWRSWRCVR
jgi:hypothetical protein